MSSIRIESLPQDNSLNSSDLFLKSSLVNENGTSTYEAKGGIGSEFGVLSGIKSGKNLNDTNLNFLNTSSTTSTTLAFNTLSSNNGIITSPTNNIIALSLDSSNKIITNQMLNGAIITTPKLVDNNVTLQKLESSVQNTLNKLNSLIFRFNASDIAKSWVNFNGYVNTSGVTPANNSSFAGTITDGIIQLDKNCNIFLSKNLGTSYITNATPLDESLVGVKFNLTFGKIINKILPFSSTDIIAGFSKTYIGNSQVNYQIISSAMYLNQIEIRIDRIFNDTSSKIYKAYFSLTNAIYPIQNYYFNGNSDFGANFSGSKLSSTGIRSSYNIINIVRNSVGNYSFFFENPLNDPYYTVVVGGSRSDGLHNYDPQLKLMYQDVNGFSMRSHDYNSDNACDITYGSVLVFGN
jgi:hypothetical protein